MMTERELISIELRALAEAIDALSPHQTMFFDHARDNGASEKAALSYARQKPLIKPAKTPSPA